MKLDELNKSGVKAAITQVGGDGALRQHFLDMGIIPGAEISFVKAAPMGDPLEYCLSGYELTLRQEDAARIECEILLLKDSDPAYFEEVSEPEHPGYGEGGIFHDKKTENPLPDEEILTFALVGNQNCGKTTLFNRLTGSNQHVGNFPGVTVDRKDGVIKGHDNTLVTDLPGIYSMSPYSSEEIVSRNFVLENRPKAVINILDATNIERNLYLTVQLLEMDIPMVVALNMMDELKGNGGYIDINGMESMLGVPVIPIAAIRNEGVDELIDHAVHIAKYQEKPVQQDFCSESDHGGAVHRCLHGVIHLIEDHAESKEIPVRFAASKIIEGDRLIMEKLDLDQNEKELLEHICAQLEMERQLDCCAAIADMRYAFIRKVCAATVKKPAESREHRRSRSIDRILTGRFTAIPMFVIIMVAVFLLTFNFIGAWLQHLLDIMINAAGSAADAGLSALNVSDGLHSLVMNGIFAGVGSVVSFLPIIVTLFFFLSLLEDSGYIARVAFFMDKLLRRIGLSGRSIVPMLIGFGCTVPAVMSTRTLPSERDRKMTILMTPFMSCSAKLPIYSFFVSSFFPGHGGLIMAGLYFAGIVLGVLNAILCKSTLFKGEAVPFVMELPNYRLPAPGNVAHLLWEKAEDFLQRAFTVIFIATIAVWFLQSFDLKLNFVSSSEESILAAIAGCFAPIMAPAGLGDWRICTSLFTGFVAKESVVSTMEVLFGSAAAAEISTLTAACMLVFSLLYTPCAAAVSSIRRELGAKWAASVVIWQCLIAWLAAAAVHLAGQLFI